MLSKSKDNSPLRLAHEVEGGNFWSIQPMKSVGEAEDGIHSTRKEGAHECSPQVHQLAHLHSIANYHAPIQRRSSNSDLPANLQSGIESLSGVSMAGVRVHYNSSKPAQLNAHAFAQGRDIHVAPGQERHLPHEAWHVVQQAQGRVKPTLQLKGVAINDDHTLEKEADLMGARALATQFNAAQLKSYDFRTQQQDLHAGGIAQLASAADLKTWAEAHAANAEYEFVEYQSDFAVLRFTGQTVGANNNCNILFHIHIPEDGKVANCYSGSLFEEAKRPEGEIQSQEVAALNTIRNRWRTSKLDAKEEVARTPTYLAAQLRIQRETEAKEVMAAMAASEEALKAVDASAEVTDEDFVLGLLRSLGLPESKGLVNLDVKDLKSGKKTREAVRQYWIDHAARKKGDANKQSGSWRKGNDD